MILGSSTIATNQNMQLRETTNYQQTEPTSLDLMSSMTSTIMGVNGSSTNNGTKERTRDLALCAVILDEWLKELSAISQEHSIIMLTDDIV